MDYNRNALMGEWGIKVRKSGPVNQMARPCKPNELPLDSLGEPKQSALELGAWLSKFVALAWSLLMVRPPKPEQSALRADDHCAAAVVSRGFRYLAYQARYRSILSF